MINLYYKMINDADVNENYIYLLEAIDEDNGFYLHNRNIVFLTRNMFEEEETINQISSDNLTLLINVTITAVSNDPSFKKGMFSLLYYKGEVSEKEITVFKRLCLLYVENRSKMSLSEYFQLIKNLFSKKKDETKLNLVGTYGELIFIYEMYKKYNLNISEFWHLNGPYSKFDFIIFEKLIEVKTTTDVDLNFVIKHDQIFGDKKVYISTVRIENNESGHTLNELVALIMDIPDFYNNIKFVINIEQVKLKIEEDNDKRYVLKDISIFDSSKIQTVNVLTKAITNLTYSLNFSNINSLEHICFVTELMKEIQK